MDTLIAIATVALLSLTAGEVHAQVLAGAALGASHQAAGNSDSSYLGPGFGGTSLAGIVMIDVGVGRRTTVGGEVSLAGDITGTQNQRAPGGSNRFVSSHHDTVFSAVVKIGAPLEQRVQASGVIGGGIAQRRTERDGTFVPFSPPFPTLAPFHASLSDYVLALAVGFDIAVGLTDHAALVGVGRLYQLKDDDRDASGVVHRGVSSTIVRYGGGLQLRF